MPPERAKKPPWYWIGKTGGRLLVLVLVTYFISKVVTAVVKLQQEKTALSLTTKYEESRFFPSISICFRNKNENYQYNGTEVEFGLNITKYASFIAFLFDI